MDFEDILNQAKHNIKKDKKKVKEAHAELDKEKARKMAALQRQKMLEKEDLKRKIEKIERRPPSPPPQPKGFKIPKKSEEKAAVDSSKIQAFLAKKEEAKKNEIERKKKEREELIKLRIQAQGGKANKKIAKHFGADPVNLQIKYGGHEHIEGLIKLREREEEEIRKISQMYKDGLEKGLSKSKQLLLKQKLDNAKAKLSTSNGSKSSGSSSSHVSRMDKGSSKPSSSSKFGSSSSSKPKESVPIKRKAPPPPDALDFDALMEKAKKNKGLSPNRLEKPATPSPSPPPPPKRASYEPPQSQKSQRPYETFSSKKIVSSFDKELEREKEKSKVNGHSSKSASKIPEKSSHSSQNGTSSSKSSEVEQKPRKPEPEPKQEKPKPDPTKFVKPLPPLKGILDNGRPAPGSLYDPNKPKKILPGDIRYSSQAASQNGSSSSRPSGSSSSRAPPPVKTFSKPVNVIKNPNKPSSSRNTDDDIERKLAQLDAERERLLAAAKAKAGKAAAAPQKTNVAPQRPNMAPNKNDVYKKAMTNGSGSSRRDSDEYRLEKIKRDERFKADQLRQMAVSNKKKPSHSDRHSHHHHSYNSFVKDSSDSESADDYDDYEEEDEYDSDLADFIDDTELDDFQQADLEETLKMINRNYDKKKWKMREKMIDDRQMTARFADIEAEERRSAKFGIIEDMREAKSGRSRAI